MVTYVPFLCFVYVYLKESSGEKYFKSIRNAAFDGRKLNENNLKTTYSDSLMVCTKYCAAEQTCLSLNYNKQTGTCVLFDLDFTDVASIGTQAEEGWLYYYFIRDYDKSLRYRCVSPAPTSDICSMFCLHYFNDATASYADFVSMCSQLDGGEIVKVDRGLKQHCVEDLLADKIDGSVLIQGTRVDTTATWKYNDGTIVTYFNWNTAGGQPNGGISEPYMATRQSANYRWHDTYDGYDHAVVCQQN